jgi:hypothetical protein
LELIRYATNAPFTKSPSSVTTLPVILIRRHRPILRRGKRPARQTLHLSELHPFADCPGCGGGYLPHVSPEERDRVRKDLLDYCERDTWSMVKLLERLGELA